MTGGLSMAVESDPGMRGHAVNYGEDNSWTRTSAPSAPYVDSQGRGWVNAWDAQPAHAVIDPVALPDGFDDGADPTNAIKPSIGKNNQLGEGSDGQHGDYVRPT